MVSYTYQMPSGIPGNVSRPGSYAIIEQWILDQTTPPLAFGVALKNVNGKIQPIAAGDTTSSIIGVLVRPYPTSGNGTDGLGVATPNKALPGDVLRKGYINIKVGGTTTPVSQGPVYVRVSGANGTTKIVGNFEAGADTSVTAAAMVGTGNATAGTLSATNSTPPGVYTIKMISATTFDVLDASGDELLHLGSTTVQYTLDNGLSFKLTAGVTPAVAGDTVAITVVQNTILCPANTYFTGGMDASNNAEIGFRI